jgi:cleavage and polyadenylation specificity factor subunit 3
MKLTSETDSSTNHNHSHSHSHDLDLPTSNPVANVSHTERLDRLFMLLEAQFGSEALAPIETPRMAPALTAAVISQDAKPLKSSDSESDSDDMSESEADIKELQDNELERLHKLGIPVPGIEIKVDKMVAQIWLEDLEVECANKIFGDRVRVVVEKAVESVASLWL